MQTKFIPYEDQKKLLIHCVLKINKIERILIRKGIIIQEKKNEPDSTGLLDVKLEELKKLEKRKNEFGSSEKEWGKII